MAASYGDPNRNLASLDELDDYRVAEEDPDPRGWEVIAGDGRRIGEVDELIVDTSAMKVRYLDCDLDEEELGIEVQDRHVLIPVGHARLQEDDRRVIVDALSSTDVPNLPPYTGDLEPGYDERFPALGRSPASEEDASRESPDVRVRRRGGLGGAENPLA